MAGEVAGRRGAPDQFDAGKQVALLLRLTWLSSEFALGCACSRRDKIVAQVWMQLSSNLQARLEVGGLQARALARERVRLARRARVQRADSANATHGSIRMPRAESRAFGRIQLTPLTAKASEQSHASQRLCISLHRSLCICTSALVCTRRAGHVRDGSFTYHGALRRTFAVAERARAPDIRTGRRSSVRTHGRSGLSTAPATPRPSAQRRVERHSANTHTRNSTHSTRSTHTTRFRNTRTRKALYRWASAGRGVGARAGEGREGGRGTKASTDELYRKEERTGRSESGGAWEAESRKRAPERLRAEESTELVLMLEGVPDTSIAGSGAQMRGCGRARTLRTARVWVGACAPPCTAVFAPSCSTAIPSFPDERGPQVRVDS
eukprot:6184170-Pleurochrysis_carterae.AAC.4